MAFPSAFPSWFYPMKPVYFIFLRGNSCSVNTVVFDLMMNNKKAPFSGTLIPVLYIKNIDLKLYAAEKHSYNSNINFCVIG